MVRRKNTLELSTCPNCKKTAHGETQVMNLFGMRQNGKYHIVQSWCMECR